MIHLGVAPPETKRAFENPWLELDYLCKKASFWLYDRGRPSRARRYVSRLAEILEALPSDDAAILRQEGFALLCELQGDARTAATFRQKEIQLMERLHKEADSGYSKEVRKFMLKDRTKRDLKRVKHILANLRDLEPPART